MCWKFCLFVDNFKGSKICPISTRSTQCVFNRIAFELFVLHYLSWFSFTSPINFTENKFVGGRKINVFLVFGDFVVRFAIGLKINHCSKLKKNRNQEPTNRIRNSVEFIELFSLGGKQLMYSIHNVPLFNLYYSITWHTRMTIAIQNSFDCMKIGRTNLKTLLLLSCEIRQQNPSIFYIDFTILRINHFSIKYLKRIMFIHFEMFRYYFVTKSKQEFLESKIFDISWFTWPVLTLLVKVILKDSNPIPDISVGVGIYVEHYVCCMQTIFHCRKQL